MTSERHYDILVVGGGPAGLAAACAAASSGRRVGLVDDNPSWGGRIWRGEANQDGNPVAQRWFATATAAGVDFLPERVVAQPYPGQLWAETARGKIVLGWKSLVLAPRLASFFCPFQDGPCRAFSARAVCKPW